MRALFKILLFPVSVVFTLISVLLNAMVHVSSLIVGAVINVLNIFAIIAAVMGQWKNMAIFGALALIVVGLFFGTLYYFFIYYNSERNNI